MAASVIEYTPVINFKLRGALRQFGSPIHWLCVPQRKPSKPYAFRSPDLSAIYRTPNPEV